MQRVDVKLCYYQSVLTLKFGIFQHFKRIWNRLEIQIWLILTISLRVATTFVHCHFLECLNALLPLHYCYSVIHCHHLFDTFKDRNVTNYLCFLTTRIVTEDLEFICLIFLFSILLFFLFFFFALGLINRTKWIFFLCVLLRHEIMICFSEAQSLGYKLAKHLFVFINTIVKIKQIIKRHTKWCKYFVMTYTI